ncbi:hypothetical protein MXD81_16625, partial [Microbacteriaceae bacterium K1510]|nr:hypothetical protein [Microbacteriaceae bacterium K1510]
MSGLEQHEESDWQGTLREYILFGFLFKAAAVDLRVIAQVPLKLPYQLLLLELSRWAEKEHYRLRERLRQKGCEVLASGKKGSMYAVQVRFKGYQREAIYSIEILRAECQELMRLWINEQGE